MFRAVGVSGLTTETLWAVTGGEIEPEAGHGGSREQLAAKGVRRGNFARRVAHRNSLGNDLAVGVVERVRGYDLSVLRIRGVDFAAHLTFVVVGLHVAPPSGH